MCVDFEFEDTEHFEMRPFIYYKLFSFLLVLYSNIILEYYMQSLYCDGINIKQCLFFKTFLHSYKYEA